MKMKNQISILIIVFMLSGLLLGGCGTVTDDDTSRQTAKPTFRGNNMIVSKEDEIQSKVIFNLKINYYPGTVFNVYDSETAEEVLPGYKVTSNSTGRQLLLETTLKGADVKPGDYWVSATQGNYKTSIRAHLTVRDFDPRQIFKAENPAGNLEKKISESDILTTQLKIVRIKGKIKASDLKALGSFTHIQKIDLSEAAIEGDKIPTAVFAERKSLKEVLLPSTVQEISAKAFENCSMLEEVDFGKESEIKIIGENAFKNCDLLVLDMDMAQLEAIESGAFLGNDSLREVNLKSQNIPEFATRAFDLNSTRITFHVVGEREEYLAVWGKKYASKLFCSPKPKVQSDKEKQTNQHGNNYGNN